MNKKGKWSSLTSNYSAQLLKSFCFKIFSTITTSCKDSSKVLCVCATSALLSLLRLCLRRWRTCAMSAAVTQKGGRPEYEGKKTWLPWHFLTLQDGQNSVEWQRVPLGSHRRFPKKTKEGDLRPIFEKCPPFETRAWARHPQFLYWSSCMTHIYHTRLWKVFF